MADAGTCTDALVQWIFRGQDSSVDHTTLMSKAHKKCVTQKSSLLSERAP